MHWWNTEGGPLGSISVQFEVIITHVFWMLSGVLREYFWEVSKLGNCLNIFITYLPTHCFFLWNEKVLGWVSIFFVVYSKLWFLLLFYYQILCNMDWFPVGHMKMTWLHSSWPGKWSWRRWHFREIFVCLVSSVFGLWDFTNFYEKKTFVVKYACCKSWYEKLNTRE